MRATPNNPFDYDPLNDPNVAMMLAQMQQRAIRERDAAFNAANGPRPPDNRDRNPFADMNRAAISREGVRQNRINTERMGLARDADAMGNRAMGMQNQASQMALNVQRSLPASAQGRVAFENDAMVASGRAQGQASGEAQRMERQSRGDPRQRIEDEYANTFLDRLLGQGQAPQRQAPQMPEIMGPYATSPVGQAAPQRGLEAVQDLPEGIRRMFEPGFMDQMQRRQAQVAEMMAADLLRQIEEVQATGGDVTEVLRSANPAAVAAAFGSETAQVLMQSRQMEGELEHQRAMQDITRMASERARGTGRNVPMTEQIGSLYDDRIRTLFERIPSGQPSGNQARGGNQQQRAAAAQRAAASREGYINDRLVPALTSIAREAIRRHGEDGAVEFMRNAIVRVGGQSLDPEQIMSIADAVVQEAVSGNSR